jgi:four helix bundle protein
MGKFQELNLWKKAKDLAVFIYKITNRGDFAKDFGFRDQIRRAAVSIPSNIAEGDELATDKQSVNYFYFAKGSSAEVLTQSIIALEIGYIKNKDFFHIDTESKAISAMLSKLIKSRSQ